MSVPSEPLPVPSAATVWPPPPTSTPETVLVEAERISVTAHGDQLVLINHKAVNNPFFSALWIVVLYFFVWLYSLWSWVGRHHLSGPLNTLWNNPSFRSEFWEFTIRYGITALGLGLFTWHRNRGSGRTVIHRATKTMTRGRDTTSIRSVLISTMRPFFVRRYFVFPTQHVGLSQSFAGVMLTFRRKENAERVAQVIAEFLDVPLRDLSRGKRGEDDDAPI